MKEEAHAVEKFIIGILILVGVLCFRTDWVPVFFMSIICTLGISLVVWLPLIYVAGFIVYELSALFARLYLKQAGADKEKPVSIDKNLRALVDYVWRERARGVSDADIALDLKGQGWTEKEITKAFPEPI